MSKWNLSCSVEHLQFSQHFIMYLFWASKARAWERTHTYKCYTKELHWIRPTLVNSKAEWPISHIHIFNNYLSSIFCCCIMRCLKYVKYLLRLNEFATKNSNCSSITYLWLQNTKQVRFLFLISDLNLPYFPKSDFLLQITITTLSEKVFEDILGSVKALPKMFLACSLRHFYNL